MVKAKRDYVCAIPEYHECLSLRPNWLPLSRKGVCPPLEPNVGGTTRLRVSGRWEPIRTTGEKAWHSVYSAG
jgi:hypothetical protein